MKKFTSASLTAAILLSVSPILSTSTTTLASVSGESASETKIQSAMNNINSLNLEFEKYLNIPVGTDISAISNRSSVIANVSSPDQVGYDSLATVTAGNVYKSMDEALKGTSTPVSNISDAKSGTRFYQPIKIVFDSNQVDLYKMTNNGHSFANINLTENKYNGIVSSNDINFVKSKFSGLIKPADNTMVDVRIITMIGNNDNDDNSKDTWSITQKNGAVKVGTKDVALYSDDDQTIANRQLGKGTIWATDEYRTNDATGKIQYRVSTHEWVDAQDADFLQIEANKTDESNKVLLKNVTKVPLGSVVVNLKPGKSYDLYKSDGTISNRKLIGGTSWISDEWSSVGSDDYCYYRVSTDEWIKYEVQKDGYGNGVFIGIDRDIPFTK
ncbi:hypothetical protein [Companilactobacillus sp.]|uniref:hypothetical protein n=1 Tax=Companilactobacillus sp. TaxID=2767905 RepID=UPI0025BE8E2C|nr:hypothetical protein [Companilactobacillus sp.]MCH4008161.1 hypothetical protein [Companilactobacillus sp.]MCH4051660.1 hypothetical protein [Companilactobacillus sp.]MCH4076104.1 hypothetical protein [Companilactobacillus sp.]MCH4124679.1 hypothetical protein [Companilactobacillus sp.]MCH4131221.1 hypothetical protein [Companilactobacillus sp.]